jgi:hypothetical protein
MKLFDPDVVNNLTSEEIAEIKVSYSRGTPQVTTKRFAISNEKIWYY